MVGWGICYECSKERGGWKSRVMKCFRIQICWQTEVVRVSQCDLTITIIILFPIYEHSQRRKKQRFPERDDRRLRDQSQVWTSTISARNFPCLLSFWCPLVLRCLLRYRKWWKSTEPFPCHWFYSLVLSELWWNSLTVKCFAQSGR